MADKIDTGSVTDAYEVDSFGRAIDYGSVADTYEVDPFGRAIEPQGATLSNAGKAGINAAAGLAGSAFSGIGAARQRRESEELQSEINAISGEQDREDQEFSDEMNQRAIDLNKKYQGLQELEFSYVQRHRKFQEKVAEGLKKRSDAKEKFGSIIEQANENTEFQDMLIQIGRM